MMEWQTPKTDWQAGDIPKTGDLNRMESNTQELKQAATINIIDPGGYFAATNVEGALAELYQKCR